MALGQQSLKLVQKGIDSLTEFNVGSLTGKPRARGEKVDLGRMPKKEAHAIDKAVYVIRSYATPIAWALSKDTWIIPTTKFSTTTAQHQSLVKTAVDNPGFYV